VKTSKRGNPLTQNKTTYNFDCYSPRACRWGELGDDPGHSMVFNRLYAATHNNPTTPI